MQSSGAQSAGGKNINENATLKIYEKKVKEDVKLIHENLHEMLKLIKLDDDKSSRVNYSIKKKIRCIFNKLLK